ncbi:hypothetical protein AAHC03_05823 [Spirometra sp. Aus1]
MQTLGDHDDYTNSRGFEYLRTNLEQVISSEARTKIDSLIREFTSLKDTEKLLFCLLLPTEEGNGILCGGSRVADEELNTSGLDVNSFGVGLFAGSGATSSLHLSNQVEQSQAYTWIMSHLEEDPSTCLRKDEVYEDYRIYCEKHNLKTLNTADFGKVMKRAFPNVRPRRLGQRGQSRYCYGGMRKKREVQPPSLPDLTVELLDQAAANRLYSAGGYNSASSTGSTGSAESISGALGSGASHLDGREKSQVTPSTDSWISEPSLRAVLGVRGPVLGDVAHVLLDHGQQVFGISFTSLFHLAQHLVGNRYVNSRSRHALALIAHFAASPSTGAGDGGPYGGLSPQSAMFIASSFSDALQKGFLASNSKFLADRQRTDKTKGAALSSPHARQTKKENSQPLKPEARTPDHELSTTPTTSLATAQQQQHTQGSAAAASAVAQTPPPPTSSRGPAYLSSPAALFQSSGFDTASTTSTSTTDAMHSSNSVTASSTAPTASPFVPYHHHHHQQQQQQMSPSLPQYSVDAVRFASSVACSLPRPQAELSASNATVATQSAAAAAAAAAAFFGRDGTSAPSASARAFSSPSASALLAAAAAATYDRGGGGGGGTALFPPPASAVAATQLAGFSTSLRSPAVKKPGYDACSPPSAYLSPLGAAGGPSMGGSPVYSYLQQQQRQRQAGAVTPSADSFGSSSSYTAGDPSSLSGQPLLSHQPPAPLPPMAGARSPYAPVSGAYKRCTPSQHHLPVDAPGAYEPVTRVHLGSASPTKRARFFSSSLSETEPSTYLDSSSHSPYSHSPAASQQEAPGSTSSFYPGRYGNLGMLSPATPCPSLPSQAELHNKLQTPPSSLSSAGGSVGSDHSLHPWQNRPSPHVSISSYPGYSPKEPATSPAFSSLSSEHQQQQQPTSAGIPNANTPASYGSSGSGGGGYVDVVSGFDNMPRLGPSPGPQIPPSSPTEFLSFYSETASKQKAAAAAAAAVVSPSVGSSAGAFVCHQTATTAITCDETDELDRTLTNLSSSETSADTANLAATVDVVSSSPSSAASSLSVTRAATQNRNSSSITGCPSVPFPRCTDANEIEKCERLHHALLTPSPPPLTSASPPTTNHNRFSNRMGQKVERTEQLGGGGGIRPSLGRETPPPSPIGGARSQHGLNCILKPSPPSSTSLSADVSPALSLPETGSVIRVFDTGIVCVCVTLYVMDVVLFGCRVDPEVIGPASAAGWSRVIVTMTTLPSVRRGAPICRRIRTGMVMSTPSRHLGAINAPFRVGYNQSQTRTSGRRRLPATG